MANTDLWIVKAQNLAHRTVVKGKPADIATKSYAKVKEKELWNT